MTATGGGPALPGPDAPARARDDGRAGVTATHVPRLRTVLGLAKVEASLLVRSLLILASLLAGCAVVWLFIHRVEPLWWDASWQIGEGQLILGMAVLVAAQLAAGRASRDGLADLYASFPATAATRALAHLAGLTGAAPASLALLGAAAVVVQLRGAIGAPGIAVLAGGLLLVIAAGAAGIAIGSRFPHPLAGVLGALALLLSSGTYRLASGATIWLVPWEITQGQLGELPGPQSGYPPAGAHAVELAGLAVLAGIVALAVTVRHARARGGLAAAGIAAVAVICLAGALQLRPIPTADLNHLVSEVADPASVQRCMTANQVRYCLYPGFGRQLPSLEAPVNGVLAHLPARPAKPLTVRQVVTLSLPDSTLTHGHPNREISQWIAQVQRAPGNAGAAPASAIYLPVGSWPAAGGQLADADFDLALAVAEWAVRIPPPATGSPTSVNFVQCVPLDQAREAVAIWLATLATHPSASELRDGLGNARGFTGSEVRNTFVQTWTYPGVGFGYVTPPGGGPQNTAAGFLLASAMTSLPEPQVAHVLTDAWGRWLNWRTTDAQLAAALGIPMPSVHTSMPLPPGGTVAPGPGNGPQSPLCTG
ncbi:MAG TPA: hypothetical protein VG123_02860 [Streptosporangiaceae bacterium]|nr:hypothetical protein [Streptosporangiaceae bacterium]